MNGNRRLTPEIAEAIALAEHFQPNEYVTKNRAFAAVQDAQGALGISAAQIGLLGQLVKASSARDWTTPGARPIVCVSNRKLCRITGMSLRTLQRQLKALQVQRLIAPKDSPNGQRKIYRGAGDNAAVYGFDLSPMAVRYLEIVELAATTKARWETESAQEREFTEMRRTVRQYTRSAVELGLDGEWQRYDAYLDTILERRKKLGTEAVLNQAHDLLIVVTEAYREAANIQIQHGMGANFDTHSNTTTTGSSECNSSEQRRDAHASQSLDLESAFGGKGFRKKPERVSPVSQLLPPQRNAKNSDPESIPLGLVTQACPEIRTYAPHGASSWRELVETAAQVRTWLGVSEHAWAEARAELGDNLAAVAVAVILEKYHAGAVKKPGGYLRGMIGKARTGELNIARTLYGLSDQAPLSH